MSKRIVLITILAEDLTAAAFLRHYVEKTLGKQVQTRSHICPGGAGEQWVREHYPVFASEQRRDVRAGFKNSALVVHVDADTDTVVAERNKLAKALQDDGQRPRGAKEQIAVVVPKRHVETWIHGLSGAIDVTEDYDYKRDWSERKNVALRSRPAADGLYQLTRRNADPPPPNMPSVAASIPELQRLER